MEPIDIFIICIVAAAVIGAIVYLVRQKKKGVGGCGCGCSGCPHAGACHTQKEIASKAENNTDVEEQTDENLTEEATHV